MTNEEAVVILENAIKKPNTRDGYLGQALTMAIKALKQQNFKDKTNGDVIKAMFPNISIVNVFGGDIWFKVDNSYLRCSESWWNSPYKESDSE